MSNNTNTNTGNNNSVLGSWALYSAANDTSCNSAFGTNSLLNHTTGSFNTSLGAGAMTFNITGNRNVAVGSSALEFNTNSENNTAIGTQALFGQRDGSNNTAIGINAGLNDVSGSFNTYLGANTDTNASATPYLKSTAIGYGARIDLSNQIVLGTSSERIDIPGRLFVQGTQITSSGGGGGSSTNLTSDNFKNTYVGNNTTLMGGPGYGESYQGLERSTAIGYGANITLTNQIVLGTSGEFVCIPSNRGLSIGKTTAPETDIALDVSGSIFVSGDYKSDVNSNTKIGSDSLYSNLTGTDNVAIGKQSLYSTQEGNYNVAIGSNSLYSNISGFHNVGIGWQSLNSNLTGTNNIAIGINSLSSNTTGGSNVSIGVQAGQNNYMSNNTFLGTSADILSTGTNIQNSTALGYQSKIDASYQIVLGTSTEFVCIPSNRGLSIGKTTAPGYALDVVGSINLTGEIYQNGSIFVSGSGGSSSNSITGGLFVSGDISCNGDLLVIGSVEAASYNATSDYRIKDNVRNLDEQDTISNLRPVKYLNKQTNKQDFGLIAHELQSEYPDLVSGEKDGQELQSVNYIGLISILIKEVQELKRITAEQAIEISTFRKG